MTKDASEPEAYAATELATFLGRVTGGDFEVTAEYSEAVTNVLVGPGAASTIAPDFSTKGLGEEGLGNSAPV